MTEIKRAALAAKKAIKDRGLLRRFRDEVLNFPLCDIEMVKEWLRKNISPYGYVPKGTGFDLLYHELRRVIREHYDYAVVGKNVVHGIVNIYRREEVIGTTLD